MKTLIAALGLGLILTASKAHASEVYYGHGVFNIENKTSVVIHYQVKWGDGAWQSWSLSPGKQRAHYNFLDHKKMIWIPYIRFNPIVGNGQTYKTHELDTNEVDAFRRNIKPDEGRPYYFEFSPDGRRLNLYAK